MPDPIYRVYINLDGNSAIITEFTIEHRNCVEHGAHPRDVAIGYAVWALDASSRGSALILLYNGEEFSKTELAVETMSFFTLDGKEGKDLFPQMKGNVRFEYDDDVQSLRVVYLPEKKTLH